MAIQDTPIIIAFSVNNEITICKCILLDTLICGAGKNSLRDQSRYFKICVPFVCVNFDEVM